MMCDKAISCYGNMFSDWEIASPASHENHASGFAMTYEKIASLPFAQKQGCVPRNDVHNA